MWCLTEYDRHRVTSACITRSISYTWTEIITYPQTQIHISYHIHIRGGIEKNLATSLSQCIYCTSYIIIIQFHHLEGLPCFEKLHSDYHTLCDYHNLKGEKKQARAELCQAQAWTSCDMDKSWTNNKWTSCEQVMSKYYVMNKSLTSHEQVINKSSRSREQVMNKSRTSHEQVQNTKSWISH